MAGAGCKVWAAAVSVIGLSSAWAAGAEPTQQELLDEIKALRSRVEQLESTRKSQAPTSQPATAAAAEASADTLLNDAARRSSPFYLAPEGFTAGFDKGKFLIQDASGNNVLHPQLQFMPRFVENIRENAHHGTDPNYQTGFEIRRLKLGFDGNIFTKDLTYNFLWATDRSSGNLVLEEAWAKYAFKEGPLRNFSLKGGQFKDPFAHESLTSSKRLLAAERTLLNDLFTGGDNFVQGASVGWDDGPDGAPFRAEVAYTDGANAANQNFQDFPATKATFGVSGRIEWLVFGKWASYEDFTTVGDKDKNPMLVIGAGVDLTQAGNNDALLHTIDVQYESGPLGIYAAYLGRANEDLRIGTDTSARDVNTYDWGYIGQVAYLIGDKLEPFARLDYIHLDQAALSSSGVENEVYEITAGVNYYYKSHNAKVTVDVTYLPNGTPLADTGADILASDGESEFIVRAQFQILL